MARDRLESYLTINPMIRRKATIQNSKIELRYLDNDELRIFNNSDKYRNSIFLYCLTGTIAVDSRTVKKEEEREKKRNERDL